MGLENQIDFLLVCKRSHVLEQLEHLRSYPVVRERLRNGSLTLHGWWFDIAKADVYAYEEAASRFVIIDEEEAARILDRLDKGGEDHE